MVVICEELLLGMYIKLWNVQNEKLGKIFVV
jgi:hypothetical protein